MVYFTSDLHFGHNKEFLYKPRGFDNIEDHDNAIIDNWNRVVEKDDIVYVLGDLMLNDQQHGSECIEKLNGEIHIIIGNHDTTNKILLYKSLPNVNFVILYADILKYKSTDGKTYYFYLSHYPTHTGNKDDKHLSETLINLYGHTHQQTNFYMENPVMYHVGVDSHNCCPISIEDIIKEIKEKLCEKL